MIEIESMCSIIKIEMETCKRIKEHFVNNEKMNKRELVTIIMDVTLTASNKGDMNDGN